MFSQFLFNIKLNIVPELSIRPINMLIPNPTVTQRPHNNPHVLDSILTALKPALNNHFQLLMQPLQVIPDARAHSEQPHCSYHLLVVVVVNVQQNYLLHLFAQLFC